VTQVREEPLPVPDPFQPLLWRRVKIRLSGSGNRCWRPWSCLQNACCSPQQAGWCGWMVHGPWLRVADHLDGDGAERLPCWRRRWHDPGEPRTLVLEEANPATMAVPQRFPHCLPSPLPESQQPNSSPEKQAWKVLTRSLPIPNLERVVTLPGVAIQSKPPNIQYGNS